MAVSALRVVALACVALASGCERRQPLQPIPPGSFAFGVFGDGPYHVFDMAQYRHVLAEAAGAGLEWFLHVGDILGRPCSDEVFADRLAGLQALPVPVIYTPGDNEWTDCHSPRAGGHRPLERLQRLRAMFFADPRNSLGGRSFALETQSDDPAFAEHVENVRWRRGGFVFLTVHMVGSDNALSPFPGRTPEDDADVERRTRAAVAWLEDAFRIAANEQLKGVVLAMHANPRLEAPPEARGPYARFVGRLQQLTASFPGTVLIIHGDTHTLRMDQPLAHPVSGEPLANFGRLETYGSPRIGWVRVVVDSLAGRVLRFEARRAPDWMLW